MAAYKHVEPEKEVDYADRIVEALKDQKIFKPLVSAHVKANSKHNKNVSCNYQQIQ